MDDICSFDLYYKLNHRYLEDLVRHQFKVKVPESIDDRYFMREILFNGYCTVFTYKNKTVCASGSLSGIGEYYKPLKFTPAVPFFETAGKVYNIGTECTVVYSSDDYENPGKNGLKDLVDAFACRLAEIDLSIDTSIVNSRVTLVPVVSDPKDAERTREILAQIRSGKPAVLSYRSSIGDKNYEIMPINARESCVVDVLTDARKNVLNAFLDMISINNVAVDKKERTNLDEMSSNDEKLGITLDAILEPIKEGFKRCSEMFGEEFSIELTDAKKKEVDADAGETLPEDSGTD